MFESINAGPGRNNADPKGKMQVPGSDNVGPRGDTLWLELMSQVLDTLFEKMKAKWHNVLV